MPRLLQLDLSWAGRPASTTHGQFAKTLAVAAELPSLCSSHFHFSLLLVCFASDIVSLSLCYFCRIKLVYGIYDELDIAEEVV